MVKFVRAWQWYRVGDLIKPPAALRQWLVISGYAIPYIPEAADTPAASTEVRRQRKRRK